MYPSFCVPLPNPFLSFACCVQYEELLHMEIERMLVKENALAVTGGLLELSDSQGSSRKWHKLSKYVHTRRAHTHTQSNSLAEQMVNSLHGSENCVVRFKQFGFMKILWPGMFFFCGSWKLTDVRVCVVRCHSNRIVNPWLSFTDVRCRIW